MINKNYKLIKRIIKLSKADNWEDAVLEWEIKEFHSGERTGDYAEERESYECLCTHKPIFNRNYIENINNKNSAIIGSCCIKKFLDKDVESWKRSINKIKEDSSKTLNVELLEFVFIKGIIREKDLLFYLDTIRKRTKITTKQLNYRKGINKKIINYFDNNKNGKQ